MEKKLEIIPPSMPNFVQFKRNPGLRQNGFKHSESFPISEFTQEEAEEFSELMKSEFMKHWRLKQAKAKN